MLNEKWRRRFMEIARSVASWSKDPSTKVGSVIVNDSRIILGVGYNGFPRYVHDHEERYNDRSAKLKYVVHAEANAILNSHNIKNSTIFVTHYPCSECAKLIAQSGIRYVVTPPGAANSKWKEDHEFARVILKEAGVFVNEYVEE